MVQKVLLALLILLPTTISAQHYKHIGVPEGLSSRKIYSIQKDKEGYMWFLTHEGIDRYNGKEFNHYNLTINGKEVNSRQDLSWLYVDYQGEIWQIGKKGRVFRYNDKKDTFETAYQIPDSEYQTTPTPIRYSFIDYQNNIWLCGDKNIYRFNPDTQEVTLIINNLGSTITCITQYDNLRFFIGTEDNVYNVELQNNTFNITSYESLKGLNFQVNELYLDEESQQLFIGTFQKGVFILDLETQAYQKLFTDISDLTITRIKPFNNSELLIATDGAGVYKVNINTKETAPYIVADYNESNLMTGNNINDIYIDTAGRIWIANYPIGLTIRDDRYSKYRWVKHAIGNPQSLSNDRVNAIIEDYEGDIWFTTGNGVSRYSFKNEKWYTYLSTFNKPDLESNHTYLSLCEVMPGVIYVGGYSSTVYQIEKKTGRVSKLPPIEEYKKISIRPDKYIQSISKDSEGYIWMGGHHNLKQIDIKNKEIRLFPELNGITTIIEKDKEHMWIGSSKGLFLLNKITGKSQRIILPVESTYIYSLCQTGENKLYIGTNGSGLLIYNIQTEMFSHFHKRNSALLSNNIYTILSDSKDNIIFSSESGLTRFFPNENDFFNWTRERGLNTIHFAPNSGTIRQDSTFLFGSSDGAIEFNKDMQLPRNHESKMVLRNFKIFYEAVYPDDKSSPLTKDINDTEEIRLSARQNIFSLEVSSINYDYPSNTLYSWKLEGFYDTWTQPGRENIIRFTNLNPGSYTLRIRAISNENRQIIEERSMKIIIAPPFWKSTWALLIYLAIIITTVTFGVRFFYLRKERKMAKEKFQFFINTAHDIRTPLTLIKAPLEEIRTNEHLTEMGEKNMSTAIRNVSVLLRLTTNLINFERMDLYSSNLYITECELNSFMNEIIQSFKAYAQAKKMNLTYESNFQYLRVWFDKEKMESVCKNIISNALKYTPENGSVKVIATETNNTWEIEVADTGIGIPAKEQKYVFKSHFRGSNAINAKISGSGIGMVLIGKQVELHKGKITLSSVENKGTTVKMSFLKGHAHFKKTHVDKEAFRSFIPQVDEEIMTNTYGKKPKYKTPQNGKRLLVVEDNDELRGYLQETLSDEYAVLTCENGKEALNVIKEYTPELIISDIMMPEMRGDELCVILKSDIETSHIPIILLTALNDEKNVVDGLEIGADEYIIKPFNINILKATIANILKRRALLRSRYANLEIEKESDDEACTNCLTSLDWKFIADIKAHVEIQMSDPEFNIDALCSAMHMSRTSMYNKIKALTDLSPSDYVRNIKLNKAAELLKEGKLNVTEVAEQTGFNDPKYFREVFKKQFKVSPSKYRNNE